MTFMYNYILQGLCIEQEICDLFMGIPTNEALSLCGLIVSLTVSLVKVSIGMGKIYVSSFST